MAEVVDDPLSVELLGGGQGRGEGGQQHQAARLHAEGGRGGLELLLSIYLFNDYIMKLKLTL